MAQQLDLVLQRQRDLAGIRAAHERVLAIDVELRDMLRPAGR
jgi:hypothetical protein